MGEVAPQRECDVCHKQKISHIIHRGDGKDDITDGTHASQSEQIEHTVAHIEVAEGIVDHGDAHDEDCPYRGEEECEEPGMREGVERGMEIELLPLLRTEHLYAGIKSCRSGHHQCEECRIKGGDIIEMHDMRVTPQQLVHAVGRDDEDEDQQEDEQVFVGEERDELRYGVVGLHEFQHLALVYPSKHPLFVSQLHPHRIDGVGRENAYVGHHQPLFLPDGEGVGREVAHRLFRHLSCEHERVGTHHEVVVDGVVVGAGEGDGVELLLGKHCRCPMPCRRSVETGREHHEQQQYGQELFHAIIYEHESTE